MISENPPGSRSLRKVKLRQNAPARRSDRPCSSLPAECLIGWDFPGAATRKLPTVGVDANDQPC